MTREPRRVARHTGAPVSEQTPGAAKSEQRWTVRSMLAWSRDWLAKKGVENPRLDAELLLAHALNLPRIRLYIEHDKPLEADELARFKALILRRAEREPVAYLLGVKEFYGRPFAVDKRAFIPRPETELLVQAVLAGLAQPEREPAVERSRQCLDQPAQTAEAAPPVALGAEHSRQCLDRAPGVSGALVSGAQLSPGALRSADPGKVRVLDLCTGSGAIGVTLAAERESLQVDLVELSPETAEVARKNATALAPGGARVLVGDLFAPLEPGTRYAAIVSNPPYVPLRDQAQLAPEITRHEPPLALFSGEDGLDAIRRIVAEAPAWLEPGGLLALELDPSQAEAARSLCASAGLIAIDVSRDLAGL